MTRWNESSRRAIPSAVVALVLGEHSEPAHLPNVRKPDGQGRILDRDHQDHLSVSALPKRVVPLLFWVVLVYAGFPSKRDRRFCTPVFSYRVGLGRVD